MFAGGTQDRVEAEDWIQRLETILMVLRGNHVTTPYFSSGDRKKAPIPKTARR